MAIEDTYKLADSANAVDVLTDQELAAWGEELRLGIDEDKQSRSNWEKQNLGWIKLATQVIEIKNRPWENASNVKVPILSVAALNFQARAFPALVPNDNVVKSVVIGDDTQGEKQQKAKRVSSFMNQQCLRLISNWYEDMDKGLFILPYSGTFFKKVYYNPITKQACSELVLPQDLIVNYYAVSMARAGRVSHYLPLTGNEIQEYIRAGLWREITLGPPQVKERPNTSTKISRTDPPSQADNTTPHDVYEIMCWRDLDNDGYEEPYVVTLVYDSREIARVKARFSKEDRSIELSEDKTKVVKITPTEYYVNYVMIPAPDSGIYGLGWGALVGPVNESVNTLINQLIDAGTLSVMPAGLIDSTVKVLGGDYKFRAGEWKRAQFVGDNLRNSFVELPSKEPSSTLFTLLQFLVGYAEKLGSSMEVMTGELPGQNTKSSVALQALEQGMKVMNSVHKRLYRSLNKELELLYKVNARNLPVETYFTVIDNKEGRSEKVLSSDFDLNSFDIMPAADVNLTSTQQQLVKAQALLEVSQISPLNMQEVQRRILEAQEQPNIEALFDVDPPGPPMEIILKQMELESAEKQKMAELQFKYDELEASMEKTQAEVIKIEADAILAFAKAESEGKKVDLERMQIAMDHVHKLNESIQKRAELISKNKELALRRQEIKSKESKAE